MEIITPIKKEVDRFKLEECITSLYQITEDIESMMHKEFDTRRKFNRRSKNEYFNRYDGVA